MVTMAEKISDYNIKKTIIKPGSEEAPVYSPGGKATFHFRTIKPSNDKKAEVIIDDSRKFGKPFELLLGKSFKIECWEECIKTMSVGEVSRFSCPIKCILGYPTAAKSLRDLYFGKKETSTHSCAMSTLEHGFGYDDLDEIQKNPIPLDFEFEILKVEEYGKYKRELWQMEQDEMVECVPQSHEQGNKLFKEKKYAEALEQYSNAISCLKHIQMKERPGTPQWVDLDNKQIPLLLNYAQCNLKLGVYSEVINNCTEVLEKIDGHNNLKALFKRGKAHAALLDEKECKADFDLLLKLDPSLEPAVNRELRNLSDLQRNRDAELATHLRGMFLKKD